eukprot:Phypoly_transcript_10000.p1 GENE.Phypoly_transcript_10000~~Phypoly_transcript_10000.p1  ORF type:complete len:424 (+),score=62.73 Phypoly_transcript_10000:72-1343(+)
MKVGEFELFVKIGGTRMRELVDSDSCKTYIITEPGQEFSLFVVNNTENQFVSIQSIFSGIPLYRKTEGKPGITTHIWHERVSDDVIKPFVIATPVHSSAISASAELHPTIKVVLFKAVPRDGTKPPFYKSLIGNHEKLASPVKTNAPHVVVTGSPQKLQYAGVSNYISTKIILAQFEIWTHSITTLHSMGVLMRSWTPVFGHESGSAYLNPPSYSCSFATSPITEFQPRLSTPTEYSQLDKALRAHGLHIFTPLAPTPLGLMEVFRILTGSRNLAFTNYLFTKSHSSFRQGLQRFSNFYGVSLYLFQCKNVEDPKIAKPSTPKSDTVTANGTTKIVSKDLLVYEIHPKAGQRIWHLGYAIGYLGGDNLVAIETNDATTSQEALSAAEKILKEKRLASIRKQMDELRQQEEALLMPPTPKKVRR